MFCSLCEKSAKHRSTSAAANGRNMSAAATGEGLPGIELDWFGGEQGAGGVVEVFLADDEDRKSVV